MDFSGRNSIESEDDIVAPPDDAARRTRRRLDPAQLAGLIEHLPGAVYRCEAKLPRRVIYLSEQIEELTGHEAEAFRTDRVRWTDLIHPDDRDAVETRLAADLAASGRFSVEYRIFHRSGEVRWVRDQGKIIREGTDEPILEGFLQDDTGRKRTESALRVGQAELSTVFKQALVGILHRDRAGNVISVNDALCRMLGRSAEELNGLPLSALIHPDDAAEHVRNFEENVATGTPYAAERRYVRPDGSIVWCEIQVSFVRGENDEVESAIALMLDITRRREVDEQRTQAIEMLRMALRGADAGLFELDLEDFSLRLSPEAVRIYGLPETHGAFLSHEEWMELVHPDDRALPPPASPDRKWIGRRSRSSFGSATLTERSAGSAASAIPSRWKRASIPASSG